MKKTMFLAGMVALALTSCSKDEELASVATSDENQIRFSVVSDKHTRASVDRGTVLTSTNLPEFKAFGTLSEGGLDVTPELNWSTFRRVVVGSNGGDDGPTLLSNSLSNLGGSNQGSNIFTFAGEGQLPRWTSGKAMDFFAFYSADQETGDMWTGTVLNYSSVGEFFKFVQNGEGNDVKTWEHPYAQVKTKAGDEYLHDGWDDLIYAVSRNVKPETKVISLNFRHALSQICFK
ncbi:MAG: fimbrillin family protein, partial [Alistipes sp.]|nr:fimbrillin family protein [Alistipes sp.]